MIVVPPCFAGRCRPPLRPVPGATAALDDDGNRLLYNWNSANVQFGTYRLESDGRYALHYYYPVDDNNTIFVELSYYLDEEGDVERIVWQRYQSET